MLINIFAYQFQELPAKHRISCGFILSGAEQIWQVSPVDQLAGRHFHVRTSWIGHPLGGLLEDHLSGRGYGLHRTQEDPASGSEPNHKWPRASVADLGLRSADDYKYWRFVHRAAPAATGSFKPDERTSHLGDWSVWRWPRARSGAGYAASEFLDHPCRVLSQGGHRTR